MRLRNLCGLLLLLSLAACDYSGAKAIKTDVYFDLVGLLDSQAELLFDKGAYLEKDLMANGEKEKMVVRPDSAGQFKIELKLFYEANINKLGLDDAYFTEELPGIDGNRKVINTAKKAGPLVRLIEYDYQQGLLHQIRILIQDKNDVYNFEKEMLLNFDQVDNDPLLTSYSITGKQSMVMKSDLDFSLQGVLMLTP